MRSLVLLLALLTLAALPCRAQSLSVNQVRTSTDSDRTRLVFELSQSADFRAFTLDGPQRLVIDLPDFHWNIGGQINEPLLGDVRMGPLQTGIKRLVFDLRRPAQVISAFLLPRSGGLPDRLVVDLKPASMSEFALAKGKIHGTLDSGTSGFNLDPAGGTLSQPVPARKPSSAVKPLIVIDAGHGGQDPGASGGKGRWEKNVTLATARELKKQLEASGRYRVQLTRDKDIFIKLADRVKIAQRVKADLFVSIHADSIDKPSVRGASVYTLSDKASDAQTEKLAARENKVDAIAGVDLSHEDKDVANILINLAMRDTMNQSKFFANTLVGHLDRGGVNTLERPHRYAGFAVLKAADIPSVLIEIGFMSNNSEATALLSDSYRRTVAGAIKSGIDAYFSKVQKNNKN